MYIRLDTVIVVIMLLSLLSLISGYIAEKKRNVGYPIDLHGLAFFQNRHGFFVSLHPHQRDAGVGIGEREARLTARKLGKTRRHGSHPTPVNVPEFQVTRAQ